MSYKHLRFPEGKCRAVTFSYDDGVPSDIKFADTISKYGIKCTFNHNAFERAGLTKEKVEEHILSKGHEIAVHGAQHKAEGLISSVELITDVLECRKHLEKKYGMIIRGMAYPDSGIRHMMPGNTYEDIKKYLKGLDILYSRTLAADNDLFMLPEDWYAWMPTAHHKNGELMKYIDEFLNIDFSGYPSSRYPRLFYLWGHSYEFDRDNNWELLEEICEKLSGKSDIWYATNMEIYDYVTAYNSLSYSADGSIVYNPSIRSVWFVIEDKLYCVRSGETLYIE